MQTIVFSLNFFLWLNGAIDDNSDIFLVLIPMYCIKCSFHFIIAGIAKQVLDRCIVSNPSTREPKNEYFEVVFDYSFVEDHRDGHKRWLIL